MIRQPIPKLKEKKACPSALKTTEEVNLLKSGLKRKSNPASAFGKVTERTHMISKIFEPKEAGGSEGIVKRGTGGYQYVERKV